MVQEPAVDPWPMCKMRSSDSVLYPAFAILKAIAVPITATPRIKASAVCVMEKPDFEVVGISQQFGHIFGAWLSPGEPRR
jgi:hypothetical protein